VRKFGGEARSRACATHPLRVFVKLVADVRVFLTSREVPKIDAHLLSTHFEWLHAIVNPNCCHVLGHKLWATKCAGTAQDARLVRGTVWSTLARALPGSSGHEHLTALHVYWHGLLVTYSLLAVALDEAALAHGGISHGDNFDAKR